MTATEWGESHLKHDLGLDLVVMSLGDEVKHGSLTTTLRQWPVKIGAKVSATAGPRRSSGILCDTRSDRHRSGSQLVAVRRSE